MTKYVDLNSLIVMVRHELRAVNDAVCFDTRERALKDGQRQALQTILNEIGHLITFDAPQPDELNVDVIVNGVSYYPAAFA